MAAGFATERQALIGVKNAVLDFVQAKYQSLSTLGAHQESSRPGLITLVGWGKLMPQKFGACSVKAMPYRWKPGRMPSWPRMRACTCKSRDRRCRVTGWSGDARRCTATLAPWRLTTSVKQASVKRTPWRSVALSSIAMATRTRSLRRLPALGASSARRGVSGALAAPAVSGPVGDFGSPGVGLPMLETLADVRYRDRGRYRFWRNGPLKS